MSLQVLKETGSVYDPVFLKILEDIPGGVTIKTNRFPTTTKEIKKGTLLNASASSLGLYNVIKTVRLTATGVSGATVLAVEPADHLFKIDELIFLWGATAGTIIRVSTTAIAVNCTMLGTGGVVASGAVLYEALSQAASTAKYDTDAILRNTVEVRKDGITTLLDNIFAGAVVRGTVDESELPYFVTDIAKIDLTARIRFA